MASQACGCSVNNRHKMSLSKIIHCERDPSYLARFCIENVEQIFHAYSALSFKMEVKLA